MGLYKRGKVWWMQFTYKGRLVRRSTEVSDKKLAEKIHAKVTTQITEGKWFERMAGEDKSLGDLLERYVADHSVPNKEERTVRLDRSIAKDILAFFGDLPLRQVTPNRIASYKAVCREKGLSPSSIRYRLCVMRHAFNYTVSKLLGHKDIKMSQRYAHHCSESLRSGVTVLDRISTISAQLAPEMAKGATDVSLTP